MNAQQHKQQVHDISLYAAAHTEAFIQNLALANNILPAEVTSRVAAALNGPSIREQLGSPNGMSYVRRSGSKAHSVQRQVEVDQLPSSSRVHRQEIAKPKRTISRKGRAAMRAAQQKRWAKHNAKKARMQLLPGGKRAA